MRRTWAVLCLAYDEIAQAPDGEARRKSMLTYAQLVSVYAKLYELHEIEAELTRLEHAVSNGDGHGR